MLAALIVSAPHHEMQLVFRLTPHDLASSTFQRGRGCPECKERGFRGRIAIVELMRVTKAIGELVAAKASADAVREAALAQNMQTLKQSGLAKARRGQTTLEEVMRVCLDED